MSDISASIVEAVATARAEKTSLYITASDTKRDLLGRHCDAATFDVSAHCGLVELQPSELNVTVRAGTTVGELEPVLAAEGLALPFDPPAFGGRASIGGTLACNLSGPGRPWSGSIRDAVLGVQLITGNAELMNFGGKVMKNVAGYDVSRLQAGAMGTLGVLSEITLKLIPRPEAVATVAFELPAQSAIDTMNARAGEPKPLTGAFWVDGILYLRLSGAASAVEHTTTQWGGDRLAPDADVWSALRDMTMPFFAGDQALWRLSHKSTAPCYDQFGSQLIDWCGAQRWVRGDIEKSGLEKTAAAAGGHCALFRGGDRNSEVRHSLGAVEQRLQQRLKHSFDPDRIFNPGRLYSWM